MTGPSSTAVGNPKGKSFLVQILITISTVSAIVFLLIKGPFQLDPYVKATTELNGSIEKGSQLFKMNCIGCHGVAARGHLAPDLKGITNHRSDKAIIHQVVKGLTPPMPSFEIEPESMADILAYLKSLS